ncbi:hypothetical protein DERP_013550 [Dermatophagoides pteronyssinus]|uniref:Uncharacterized protein n=1 Tax=Dermatophagoides pteronyssinus TaxID=6956 RepID=A0ABQ8J5K4_DERPT|nr:hypothetical protein DERP_013550 [Dermatophagoides pteronyssinus]
MQRIGHCKFFEESTRSLLMGTISSGSSSGSASLIKITSSSKSSSKPGSSMSRISGSADASISSIGKSREAL